MGKLTNICTYAESRYTEVHGLGIAPSYESLPQSQIAHEILTLATTVIRTKDGPGSPAFTDPNMALEFLNNLTRAYQVQASPDLVGIHRPLFCNFRNRLIKISRQQSQAPPVVQPKDFFTPPPPVEPLQSHDQNIPPKDMRFGFLSPAIATIPTRMGEAAVAAGQKKEECVIS